MDADSSVVWAVQSIWHAYLTISVREFLVVVFIACRGRDC